jgi:hypothetical protein
MATHDYSLANQSGASFRTDLNNALAAIQSNNSNSSAPSTTAAYMWWADTTSGTLKIRNSSNNAWIELLQLDGTLTLEDGSVSAPALAFRDDLDTGIYSPSANTIAIATGGVERLQLSTGGFIFNEGGVDIDFRIESDTNANAFTLDAGDSTIGINVSPVANRAPLHVHRVSSSDCHVHLTNTDTGTTQNDGLSIFVDSVHGGVWLREDAPLLFATHDQERYRVDGDGRFLIGHTISTPMDNDANNPIFAVEGGGNNCRIGIRSNDATAGNGAFIYLTRTRGTSVGSKTTVQSGDSLGGFIFMGADGTHDTRAAIIQAECDGTPGDNDMPGRLVFMTTPDGGINAVEHMRIRSDGRVTVGGSSGTGYTGEFGIHGTTDLLDLNSSSSSGAGKIKMYEGGSGRMNIETLGGESGLLIYDALNAATRVKIHSNGHISFNKTNTADSSGTGFVFRTDSAAPNMSNVMDTSTANNSTYHLYNVNATNNGYRFYVQADGGVSNFSGNNNNLSDEREKKNITLMGSVFNTFKQFVFKDFNYISESDSITKKHGLIAQDVELIDSDLVNDGFKTGVDSEGNEVLRKGLKEEQFMMIGFKALQEAIAKIEVLETKVAALEAA